MRPTQWIAITGAPCSGKTAVIDALSRRGFRVVPEAARAIIDRRLKAGKSLAAIRSDPLALQRAVLASKRESERALPVSATVFWDRGLPDGLAYYRLHGLDADEVRRHCRYRYRHVFILDRLPMRLDPVRSEDDATARQLERLLTAAYGELGYRPTRVPLLTIDQRIDFILSHADLPAAAAADA